MGFFWTNSRFSTHYRSCLDLNRILSSPNWTWNEKSSPEWTRNSRSTQSCKDRSGEHVYDGMFRGGCFFKHRSWEHSYLLQFASIFLRNVQKWVFFGHLRQKSTYNRIFRVQKTTNFDPILRLNLLTAQCILCFSTKKCCAKFLRKKIDANLTGISGIWDRCSRAYYIGLSRPVKVADCMILFSHPEWTLFRTQSGHFFAPRVDTIFCKNFTSQTRLW